MAEEKETTEQPFKSFESQEEFDKYTQSTSSKSKNDMLKSLGIESIEDFKKQQAATAKLSKDSKQKELDEADEYGKLKITHADMIKTLETANTTIAGLQGDKLQQADLLSVMKIPNVNQAKANEMLILAKSRVTNDNDLQAALKSVAEDFPSFTGGEQQESFSFGSDKKGRKQDSTNINDNMLSAIWGGNPPK